MTRRALAAFLALALPGSPAAWAASASRGPELPVTGLPSLPADLPAAPVPPSLAAQAPTLPVLPPLAAPAASPQSPEAAKLGLPAKEAVFAGIKPDDLPSLPPEQAGTTGQVIMDRLQGAASAVDAAAPLEAAPAAPSLGLGSPLEGPGPGGPGSPAPPRLTYLLPEPLTVRVKLGPTAQVLHYLGEAAFQLAKTVGVWRAGAPATAVAWLMVDLLKMPMVIPAQSLADLGARYWWRKLKVLKGLARTPGVEAIKILKTGETRFKGLVAQSQSNRGLVLLQSSKPLEFGDGSGAPVLIRDLSAAQLRLALSLGGTASGSPWSVSLKDLLEKRPIPREVAEAWRAEIRRFEAKRSRLARALEYEAEKAIGIQTTLILPGGAEKPLDKLAEGHGVKSLLRITRWDRFWGRLGRFFGRPARPERSIPLDEIEVVRQKPRFSFRDLLRGIVGKLIVILGP